MSRLFEEFGVEFKEGETIFTEGDPPENLYMVHRGKVRIQKNSGHGAETLNILGDTDFFGEMSLISSEPRNATAVAQTDCQLIQMDRASFERTIRDNPNYALTVIRMLTSRLKSADTMLADLLVERKGNKIIAELFKHSIEHGKRDSAEKAILVPVESAIAHLQSKQMTTDEINATIKELKNSGQLSYKRDENAKKWISLNG